MIIMVCLASLSILLVSLAAVANASMYPSTSEVVELNPSNFDQLVVQSDNLWIVEFYATWCGHCQQLVPEYTKAAKALKGVVKVGAVNADEHKSLGGQYGVRGFPTLKVFGTGTDKNKPVEFNGQRTAQGIVDGAFAALKSKVNVQMGGKKLEDSDSGSKGNPEDVVELTDSNFELLVMKSDDLWLVEFFAPWCGHCKNLAPHWAQAASELKGKVKLGTLDATVHTVKTDQYQVKGYPTIKAFSSGTKDSSSVSDYNGGRTASDIVNWALQKLAENLPAPTIDQLIDAASLKTNCEGHPLCVVSVLPHILDCQAECRNSYIDILVKLGEKYKKKMWGWVWSEAGAQSELESTLEIGSFGYPTLAVMNTKKMKYSIFRGSFSYDGINEFLRDLSFGRGSTWPVKGSTLPSVSTIEVWDGNDCELPPDNDIDLSNIDIDQLKDEL